MKTASIVGIILMILGIIVLAYQSSPRRRIVQATTEQHKTNPVQLILGGPALVGGIALLFAGRWVG
jgi:uncharacterized membrane protein